MQKKLVTLLSIAGSDPTGGAGIQADIRVGSSLGLHVATAVTAVTVQNSNGFYEMGYVEPSLLQSQLQAIINEVTPNAIKIGMLGNKENFPVVSDFLKSIDKKIPVVIDPILKASLENQNIEEEYLMNLYCHFLFPYSTVITPNLPEFNILKGIYKDWERLNLVIKGGHLEGEEIEDILIIKNKKLSASHKRIECSNLHGTGCVFSSFFASYLALEYSVEESFYLTSQKIQDIIAGSCNYTLGLSTYGPLNINNYKL